MIRVDPVQFFLPDPVPVRQVSDTTRTQRILKPMLTQDLVDLREFRITVREDMRLPVPHRRSEPPPELRNLIFRHDRLTEDPEGFRDDRRSLIPRSTRITHRRRP